MNKKDLNYFLEKAQKLGKELLIEEYSLSISPKQIEVPEKEIIVESADTGKKYKSRAIIRNVPTSKFTENLNGRIYPKKLDERIIKEGYADGTLSLADHPTDEASVTRICGVWHNPTLDDKHSYGDWYLVGEYGQLIKESIEAGGKIGVSRVGYGEFEEDGKTVKWDTYDLERYGDAVLTPSQSTYATLENIQETQKTNIPENNFTNNYNNNEYTEQTNQKEEKSNILKKDITNKYNEEQNNEVIIMDKLQEKSYNKLVKLEVESIIAKENLSEAINDLRQVDTQGIASAEQIVDKAISDVQAKINEQKAQMEKDLKEKSEKFDAIEKELTETKAKYEKAKAIVEKLGFEESVDVEKLSEEKEALKEAQEKIQKFEEEIKGYQDNEKLMNEDLNCFKEDFSMMKDDLNCFLEDTDLRDNDIRCLVEDMELRDYDIACLVEDSEFMKNDIKILKENIEKAEDTISIYEKMLEELGYNFEEANCDDDKKEEESDEDKKKESKKTESDDMDADDKKEEEDDKEELKDEKKEKKEEDVITEYKFDSFYKEVSTPKETTKANLKEKAEKKDIPEIKKFYERQVAKYGSLAEIKEEILGAGSLLKAVEIVDTFKESNTTKDELVEMTKKDEDEIIEYKFRR